MRRKFSTFLLSSLLVIFSFVSLDLRAAWLDNVPNQLTQPDGNVIDVLFSGDEFHNWAHDKDYYTIIQDEKTGYWCWAQAVDGDLVSTGKAIHLTTPQSLGLNPRENISNERYLQKREYFDYTLSLRNERCPSVGVINNLVVFIRFSTDSEFNVLTSYYDDMFNNQGENVNSLYQYFYDSSYGQVEVFSPFFPIAENSTVVSYQSPNPRSYYQPYNATTNPNGYLENQRTQREHQLLADAIAYIHDQVPTDLIIDSDGDGYVDNVCFVVRGGTGAWADLLWPHRWTLFSQNVFLHGKRVYDYNFNIENHMNHSGVSVLAHEMTHSFGAPDFYRYVNPGTPIGPWDLMASNTNPAQSLSAFTKYKYTDWVTEIPEITLSGTYTLFPNTVSQYNHAYKIPSPNSSSEYFVVEYRSKLTGLTDSAIPGTGLLVYRINTLAGNGNAQGPPDELYIYRPNGTLTSDGQINAAHFSLESGRTSINDLTNPNSFLSNNTAGGLNISEISATGDSITFYVNIDGADPLDIDESFEDQTFTNFDWILNPNASWYITDEAASDGNYSATSPSIGNNQSSKLDVTMQVDSGYLQFYVKTSTQFGGDFLKFYINNVEMKSWSGVTNWTHYAIPVAAGTYNFAWVYEKDASGVFGADKVWIDQIGFPEIIGHILYPPRNLSYTSSGSDINLSWHSPFTTSMPDGPTLLGYNVFQNGIQINEELVIENSYTIINSTGGSLQFWIVAVYNDGDSESSNIISVPMPFAVPINLNASIENGAIRLNWDFPYNSLSLFGFRVYRNNINITTPPVSGNEVSFLDLNLVEGQTYTYFVRAMYMNPAGLSEPSNQVEIYFTDITDDINPVLVTELKRNYPNPFNPLTNINFSLKNDEFVEIKVYNIKGELVKILVNNHLDKGYHSVVWDGKDTHGKSSASGVYFYKMITNSYNSVNKMLLIK